MRISDLSVLTMNELTLIPDPRIRSIHVPGSDRWALRIQDSRMGDSGLYECQVTTPNKTIEMVTLNVLGEKTDLTFHKIVLFPANPIHSINDDYFPMHCTWSVSLFQKIPSRPFLVPARCSLARALP